MGNTQALTPKTENEVVVLTDTLLQKFQEHITLVDNTVTGLAKAIDVLPLIYSTCLNDSDGGKKGGDSEGENLRETILTTLFECISESKTVVVECVKNLLNLIVENGKRHIEPACEFRPLLRLNDYIQQEFSETKENNFMAEFVSRSLHNMKKQVALLNETIALQKQEIDALVCKWESRRHLERLENDNATVDPQKTSENEGRYQDHVVCRESKMELFGTARTDEKTEVKEQTTELEEKKNKQTEYANELDANECAKSQMEVTERKQFGNMKEQRVQLGEPQEEYEDEFQDVRMKFDMLRKTTEVSFSVPKRANETFTTRKPVTDKGTQTPELELSLAIPQPSKSVYVQVYHKDTFVSKQAEKELHALLKKKLAEREVYLTIQQATPYRFEEKKPFLISCEHRIKFVGLRNNTVPNALKEFGKKIRPNMALVVFHRATAGKLQESIEQVKSKENDLGGVYHIGHENTMYDSDLNTKSVQDIVEFIASSDSVETVV